MASCLPQGIDPKCHFNGPWPSLFRVVELFPCLFMEITDSLFSLDIMEVRIQFKVWYHLVFLRECLLEGFVYKSSIVCMVITYLDLACPILSLKCFLCFYRFFLWQSSLQVHVGHITVVIQEYLCREVTMISGISLGLDNKYWSARLRPINWYAFSRGGSLPYRSSVLHGLCLPWVLFHGEIEAPSTLGWIHLEELPWEYTQGC